MDYSYRRRRWRRRGARLPLQLTKPWLRACLRNKNVLVEREEWQFREMAQQKQMYDRQVIESLQWMINKFCMQCEELEVFSSDRAVSETSEDARDKRL
jgi:hypothetical protein